MTDEELEALYWAAFEAEIRAVADAAWPVVYEHAQAPSIAGLRAAYEAGTKRMSNRFEEDQDD